MPPSAYYKHHVHLNTKHLAGAHEKIVDGLLSKDLTKGTNMSVFTPTNEDKAPDTKPAAPSEPAQPASK